MKISIFGIGYVGAVVSACMADEGHAVVAVDVAREKVDRINAGLSPISEPLLGELIHRAVAEGRLRATTDARDAIAGTDLSFVCVGTPSQANGALDLGYVARVTEEIGAALRDKEERHTIVVRSTILPGSMMRIVLPLLERASGKRAGADFGVGYYPEFLREGSAVEDFRRPVTAVFGTLDEATAAILSELNGPNGATICATDITTAEAIKYTNNAWHALKISFANEIGTICKASGVDGGKVMEILCADTKLNISRAYMRPGFAFGGSCLPKDLRALSYHATQHDVAPLLLQATLAVNERQVSRAFAAVAASPSRDVALLGLTFKPHTDDLRESPMVELAERLVGKGFRVRIFDPDLQIPDLIGANRSFAMKHLPHLSNLLVPELGATLAEAGTVVVGNGHPAFRGIAAMLRPEHRIIDLAGTDPGLRAHPNYDGACW